MAVKARFYVGTITQHANGAGWADPKPVGSVKLHACVRGPENKEWASATPSGNIEMMLGNTEAWKWFQDRLNAGQDISITFEVAEPVE